MVIFICLIQILKDKKQSENDKARLNRSLTNLLFLFLCHHRPTFCSYFDSQNKLKTHNSVNIELRIQILLMRNIILLQLFIGIICQNIRPNPVSRAQAQRIANARAGQIYSSARLRNGPTPQRDTGADMCPNSDQCVCRQQQPMLCVRCYDTNKDTKTNCTTCLPPLALHSDNACYPPGRYCDISLCKCLPDSSECVQCHDPRRQIETGCKQCYGPVNSYGQCLGSEGLCPKGCICHSENPRKCTGCEDPNRDLLTQCKQCNVGLLLYDNGTCFNYALCPVFCNCESMNLVYCTSCKGPNRNRSTLCATCMVGSTINNATGMCVKSVDCQSYCYCNQERICAVCKDPNMDVNTNCLKCQEGYLYDSEQQRCKAIKQCHKDLCQCRSSLIPGKCTMCYDKFRDPSTDCMLCLPGHVINTTAYGICYQSQQCPVLCICLDDNPSACIGCRDSRADQKTNCTTCKKGYSKFNSRKCKKLICDYQLCKCEDEICTRCHDPNRNLSVWCQACNSGFQLNANGLCVPLTCPQGCICSSSGRCIACIDPNKNLSILCAACNTGYRTRSWTKQCFLSSELMCPPYCACSTAEVCIACIDSHRDLSTNCTTCKENYVLLQNRCRLNPGISVSSSEYTALYNSLPSFSELNQNSQAISSNRASCSPGCICDSNAECVNCQDQTRSASSLCTQCIQNYTFNGRACVPGSNLSSGKIPCPQGCVCDNNSNCVSCVIANFDPSTKCSSCFNNFIRFQNTCIPECTPRCNCVNGKCLSCLNQQFDVMTFCMCLKGQKLNANNVCVR